MENIFKVYCHPKAGAVFEDGLLECLDVSIQGNPDSLRKIGEFLILCADRFDGLNNDEVAHFHLSDELKSWGEGCPDIIGVSLPSDAKG
ncbi:Imm32 family immunity protein [Ralstonia solanacearum]|uniref:Imm32 family immunity protein n=1 Tax=Ralstonia solanacearum TaxID=305 RepID=UPI001FF8CAE0